MAIDVDATSAGSPCELRVFPRGEIDMRLTIPFDEALQHDRLRGHIDTQSECLSGKDCLDQSALEKGLDRLLEYRQQPGVVSGDPSLKCVEPGIEPQGAKVLIRDAQGCRKCNFSNLPAFIGARESQASFKRLFDRVIAARAAEQEVDAWEQALAIEAINDLTSPRG